MSILYHRHILTMQRFFILVHSPCNAKYKPHLSIILKIMEVIYGALCLPDFVIHVALAHFTDVH